MSSDKEIHEDHVVDVPEGNVVEVPEENLAEHVDVFHPCRAPKATFSGDLKSMTSSLSRPSAGFSLHSTGKPQRPTLDTLLVHAIFFCVSFFRLKRCLLQVD